MTSKRLFFRAMREDMRHRGWMVALSLLGSFFILPLVWLIVVNNPDNFFRYTLAADTHTAMAEGFDLADAYVAMAGDFWRMINIFGGLFAIGGALVAGLAGFRYVFHKNQVDTWHSLPVKRNTLFWVYYINGCVVWLLPLLVCTLLTAALSGGMVLRESGAETVYGVAKYAAGDFAVWVLIFLLVYHLVLVAIMISGNVLNTIVSMLIMGVGSASLYGLVLMMCVQYFDAFYFPHVGRGIAALYASPFVLAVMLLAERMEGLADFSMGVSLAVTLLLWALAWFLYHRRPSELAEQGIRSRVFSVALRTAVTVGTGMGGWLIFGVLTDNVLWEVFGAVFAAVMVFGVLDIVFQMDFRAFFSHRLQMAGTVAAVLLVCFAFYGDWFGYDAYLPREEQIAKMGIEIDSLSSKSAGRISLGIDYRDTESIHAFLREATENFEGGESAYVSVTLKNGRTYYRRYPIRGEMIDVLMPIVSSEEYLNAAYCLDENLPKQQKCRIQVVQGAQEYAEREFAQGELQELLLAYDRDVLENPETVLLGEGRLLAKIRVYDLSQGNRHISATLEVYESMERTVGALRELGYEDVVTPMKASDIASVNLSAAGYGRYVTAGEAVNAAEREYGVYIDAGDAAQAVPTAGAEAVEINETADPVYLELQTLRLYITEPQEIEELLPLISYDGGYRRWGAFKRNFVDISITDKNGDIIIAYIKRGDLPEKYILRFGELVQGGL